MRWGKGYFGRGHLDWDYIHARSHVSWGRIRTITTSVPVSVSLPHLCLYPYVCPCFCVQPQKLQDLQPHPGLLGSLKTAALMYTLYISQTITHFLGILGLSRQGGGANPRLVSLDQRRLKAVPRTPESEAEWEFLPDGDKEQEVQKALASANLPSAQINARLKFMMVPGHNCKQFVQ